MPRAQSGNASQSDRRLAYYQQVSRHGSRFREFDSAAAETMLTLFYVHDVLLGEVSRVLASERLSPGAFNVLMILARHEDKQCPLHELGELLIVSRANVTGIVDGLENRGLVERVADERDRRVRLAHLTEAGEELLERLLPKHFRNVHDICKPLNSSEKKTLSALLMRLTESVQARAAGRR
jgi:MarR family 2-MHQ and catechol resistance regulon transcriptional repressor